MDGQSCRLCSTSTTDPCLNIFSERGIEMEMSDILSEHFKCDVNIHNHNDFSDPLPNVVCEICWQTTESFHELYKTSKEVQEMFLNSLVKSEPDPIDTSNVECIPIIEEIDSVKFEHDTGNADELHTGPLTKTNVNGSDVESFDNDSNGEENANENDPEDDGEYKTREQKKKRKPSQAKEKNKEFQKMFNEYRHLFDMSCDCCEKTFESLDEARAHYSTQHNNPKGYIKSTSGSKLFNRYGVKQCIDRYLNPHKFKCNECGRMISSKSVLVRHMRLHQKIDTKPKEKRVQCDICEKAFTDIRGLEQHKKLHKIDTQDMDMYNKFIADNFDMSCDQCDGKFTALYDACQHYRDKHNENSGYIKCCGEKLRKLWIIHDHINTHLNPDFFKCNLCKKTFKTRRLMTRHKLRHRRLICDYCGKIFNEKESITNHLLAKHVSSEPKFECETCHKRFQTPSLLRNHEYAVHREKKTSVTCEICGKSFYSKFFLDKHMVTTHTDKSERLAMRKQCEHCQEWLLTSTGIYYHKLIHTTGVQKCDQCGMELANKLALKRHIIEYHRAHKFKCGHCEKTFSSGAKLRKHEESHTRHKTYQCKFCPKAFTVHSSLGTHTRRNHKEEHEMSKQVNKSAEKSPFKS